MVKEGGAAVLCCWILLTVPLSHCIPPLLLQELDDAERFLARGR